MAIHGRRGAGAEHPGIGEREPDILDTGNQAVFVLAYRDGERMTVTVYNLGSEDRWVTLDSLDGHRYLYDVLADRCYDPVSEDWTLQIDGYGYRWLTIPEPHTSRSGSAWGSS